jgi:hypothetical protein
MPPKNKADPPPPPDPGEEQRAQDLLNLALEDVDSLRQDLDAVRRDTRRIGDPNLPNARGMTVWPARANYMGYIGHEGRRLRALDLAVDSATTTLRPINSRM